VVRRTSAAVQRRHVRQAEEMPVLFCATPAQFALALNVRSQRQPASVHALPAMSRVMLVFACG